MIQNNYEGALQKPIGSGLNAASTTSDVIKGIDLTGKMAIVTGGYTGIGLETTKTLAAAGATVIVPARSIEKAKKNLAGIENVAIEEMDLMNHTSIDRFAEKFLASGRPLHLLINNAGIMFVPLRRDSRGIESQLVTNHLAPFQLTARLWDALKKANGARVVNVSSQGHQFAPFNFEDPNFENRTYETLSGYGQSKTAVNLFSLELDHRARAFNVRAYALHPGNIMGTELAREASVEIFHQLGLSDDKGDLLPEFAASMKTIPQGAATTIWSATSPLLNNIGGVYCEDGDIAGLALGQEISAGVKPYSLEEANAKRLWELSEKMTGITFNLSRV
ncbi:SDR family NAD(P)-dependent oxidoreductase [Sinomicrobium weinanense]|uniref:SDR family NAD(P)-dependent oxidoreductase n=1 Tax=Sinomicrobium weinanense TaxID=2842200 RepID=A0A926JP48_9FLAO|nr:SDR family NAD(P)-dependent oxidoreductase [Sinomicrobium weinanense]MBC9794697.1 SDR family NAD(P)-dependent oxidoreductase [Sinomicrobium weinanense]MBU3124182.1 SDR family NAD(P)-dependent oxidoreductase [Sinomicrobium weinanense]